jgi:peptide/nickel transport system substrate-binding protein
MRGLHFVPLALAALTAAACTGAQPQPGPSSPPGPVLPTATPFVYRPTNPPTYLSGRLPSGTARTAVEDFGFSASLDPVGETSRLGIALESQLLVRTLVTYRHAAGRAGLEVVPDLATDAGQVSADGFTWTFTLKDGVRFGPPLDRPITSHDVEFAFRRIDTAGLQAAYGYLYDGLIEGMNGSLSRRPRDISGIETPDARTIVFHLSRPAGDFGHRLSLPAAGPVPPEVAGCFGKPGPYGRRLVSSGPYMLWKANELDASSCRSLRPVAGFVPSKELLLVRNPTYDPATDSQEARESRPDAVDIRIEDHSDEIGRQLGFGWIDATLGVFPPDLQPSTPGLDRIVVHAEALPSLEYLSMNLLVPPFDDVHVRRAVNLAINRDELVRLVFGGPIRGPVATHVFPPVLVSDPGPAPPTLPQTGDLGAAKQEMALSRYDSNRDGVCDSTVCERVLFVSRTTPPEVNATPLLQQELAAIGIHLFIRELDGPAYTTFPTVRNLIPISLHQSLMPLYPDAGGMARSLHSSGITCEDQINYSEVGIGEDKARECRVLRWYRAVADRVPNIDGRIEACERLAGEARASCWTEFDRYLMEEVVPWVPLRWPATEIATGPSVIGFEYDQAFGILSFAHLKLVTERPP